MTRQDYIKIARALGRANAVVNDQGWDERIHAGFMADVLAADNPRFDRTRFLLAVGNETTEHETALEAQS